MTALNAHAVGSRAYIISDTAAYDLDGIVHGHVSKVITVPHLRMAIATRGSVMALPDISIALTTKCQTFDEVLERAAEIVEETYNDRLPYWFDLSGSAHLSVMVAGYSERQRKAVVGFLASEDQPQYPAFELYITPVLVTPHAPEDQLRAAGVLGPGGFDARDPAAGLLKVIEIQRRERFEFTPGNPATLGYAVGGHAVLTEITEAGISQRIARTWPDRIGEHIHPAPAAVVDRDPTRSNMSRQQRRALEAQSRKAVRDAVA